MSAPAKACSEVLAHDHRAMDTDFEAFRTLPAGTGTRRRELFERFASELRHHIRVEEELLFPVFGEGDPGRKALVDRMLEEHRRIEGVLDQIERSLAVEERATGDLEFDLINVLWAHNAREEESVYPWFDTHLPPEARTAVMRELDRSESAGSTP